MEKKDFIYLGIIFILLLGLVISLIALFDLNSDFERANRIKHMKAVLTENQIHILSKDILKENGFYLPPAIILFGKDTSINALELYNKFDEEKNFTFNLYPNTTIPFFYEGINFLYDRDPFVLSSNESNLIPLVVNAEGDFSSTNTGQYVVEILANNEKIGQSNLLVFVVTEEQLRSEKSFSN